MGGSCATDSGKFSHAYLALAFANPLSPAFVLAFQSLISPSIRRFKSANSSASSLSTLANSLIDFDASEPLEMANKTEIIDALPLSSSRLLLTSKVRLAES